QGIAMQELDGAACPQGPLPFHSEEAGCLDGQERTQALATSQDCMTHSGHEAGRPGNLARSGFV
ncbi:MAG: hypothetical protein ACJ8DW_20580, partial [Microvirga sp.]